MPHITKAYPTTDPEDPMDTRETRQHDDTPAMAALRELVRLKDGPRDAAYERDKPLAWDRAREVLAGELAGREGLYADAVNLAADRSPFGHPLPEAEIRAARAGVDAALAGAVGGIADALASAASSIEMGGPDWSDDAREGVEYAVTFLRDAAAKAATDPAAEPVAKLCSWCEALASGTAQHNDGTRYPACPAHGLPGTFVSGFDR